MKSTFRSHLRLSVIGAIAFSAASAPLLYAQDAAEAAPEEAQQTLWDLIVAGGWAMYPLGIFSVCMITLAVYNAMQLTRKKFVPPMLKQSVLTHMGEVRVRSAIEEAAESPSYLGRMMATSLPHVDATEPETLGREKVEDAMADFAIKENPTYMAWVGYFSVLAQASPMVGLLGTVSGMIKAFQTLGLSGGSDPAKLAANISEALMTTATGLVVAIPCLFCFYIFKNKFNQLATEAQEALAQSMDAAIATVNADQQLAKVPEGIAEA
ncbi:MAG: MotA/TolQ/ExbB proton channel family protein [Verrucomicrobiae bacterium]|nr:MotA/TolQ/ExbB proton channel family protein [Verrucomicrobiae bacterium]